MTNIVSDALDLIGSEAIYDASGEQTQCWFHHAPGGLLEPQLIRVGFMIDNLDTDLFRQAIEIMFRRHESLRTFFKIIEGKVKQCVLPFSKGVFPSSYFDVTRETNINEAILRIIKSSGYSLNDLGVPPLWKCCVIKCSDRCHYISIVIHHIISDEWSKTIIREELIQSYNSLRNGVGVEIDANRMQLRDYTEWQNKWRAEHRDSSRSYWRNKMSCFEDKYLFERLSDRNSFLDHPHATGNPRPAKKNNNELFDILDRSQTGIFVHHIHDPEYIRLKELSIYCKSTLFSVLNASLQILFLLLTGKPLIIGTLLANRFIPGTKSIIGYLIASIYLRAKISDGMTIKDLVRENYLDFLESCTYPVYDHADIEFHENLRLHIDLNVNFKNKEIGGKKKLDVQEVREHSIFEKREFFALTYDIGEFEDGLSCRWLYARDLYPITTIDYIVGLHKKVLKGMPEFPGISIKEFTERFNLIVS